MDGQQTDGRTDERTDDGRPDNGQPHDNETISNTLSSTDDLRSADLKIRNVISFQYFFTHILCNVDLLDIGQC